MRYDNIVPRGKTRRTHDRQEEIVMKKSITGITAAALVVVLLVAGYATMTVRVPTGYTAIVTTFGRVEDYTLEAGFHFKSPVQNVVLMDNRIQKVSFVTQAFSSDIQQVDIAGSINFSIDKQTAMRLYSGIGVNYFENLLHPRLLEKIKSVISAYTAEELIGKRDMLSDTIVEGLRVEMMDYGISIASVNLEDIDFTDAFTDAIEAKQVATQRALQAKVEQEQKTMEAQAAAERQKIDAEAAAEVARIQAEAAQYAGEKEAEMNRKLAESLTGDLVRYYLVQKWDGALPRFMTSSSDNMILDIAGAMADGAE